MTAGAGATYGIRETRRNGNGRSASRASLSRRLCSHGGAAMVLGFSAQWPDPSPDAPFRYGGAVRPASLPGEIEGALASAAGKIVEALGLVGLNSVDFLVARGRLASDRGQSAARRDARHLSTRGRQPLRAACRGVPRRRSRRSRPTFAGAAAARIVYARRDIRQRARNSTGPNGPPTASRPAPRVAAGAPLCTVLAAGRDGRGGAAPGRGARRGDARAHWEPADGRLQPQCARRRTRRPHGRGGGAASHRRQRGRARRDASSIAAPSASGRHRGGPAAWRRSAWAGSARSASRRPRRRRAGRGMSWCARSQPVDRLPRQPVCRLGAEARGRRREVLRARLRAGARARPPRAAVRRAGASRESPIAPCWCSNRTTPPPPRDRREGRASDCGVRAGPPHHPLRADPQPRRLGADRGARGGGGAAQGACAEVPARPHRRRGRQRAAQPAASRFHDRHGPHQRRHHLRRPRAAFRRRAGGRGARSSPSKLPSAASRDYGAPFAEIFKRFGGDFYAIDPMLFSPAAVAVTALESGETLSRRRRIGATSSMLRSPDGARPRAPARPRRASCSSPRRATGTRASCRAALSGAASTSTVMRLEDCAFDTRVAVRAAPRQARRAAGRRARAHHLGRKLRGRHAAARRPARA